MSKIEWPSEQEKWMAIGYLAKRGTISSIEATVPKGKSYEFQRKFRGKFDSNYPYEANKYGRQFRIYLNDTEGCPTFLYDQLDEQYKNRINDTEFIEELVLDWGFRFSNSSQPELAISRIVRRKGKEVYKYYEQGRQPERTFIKSLKERMAGDDELSLPTIKDLSGAKPHKSRKKGAKLSQSTKEYPPGYLMHLGWLGEEYIFNLLINKHPALYEELGLTSLSVSDVVWFNQGFQTNPTGMGWEDQSVGYGCDFLIRTTAGVYYIEVKASKRKYPVFTMTAAEIQKMAEAGERYFLIKINYLERILNATSPEVCVYKNPFEYFFNVEQIKEATFYLE